MDWERLNKAQFECFQFGYMGTVRVVQGQMVVELDQGAGVIHVASQGTIDVIEGDQGKTVEGERVLISCCFMDWKNDTT